ncbi:MAG: hypothetical protein SFY56_03605 [Bacteroidota bacterium]|nr:hypothetical protein [Bacteroidota bacterium]
MFFKQPAFKYSLYYFLFSRLALCAIGYLTINEFKLHSIERYSCGVYSENKFLNLFGNYDTGWYLDIAENWYPILKNYPDGTNFAQYNFFPLYPALIKLIGTFTPLSFFVAALLISNLCLIGSGFIMHKIATLFYNNSIAKKIVAFLYASPVSFLLSGAYSESLYLFLLLLSIYYALKHKWLLSGIAALLVTLSRPIGVFIFFPLLVIYLQHLNFNLKSINKQILFLLFIPLGVVLLMLHSYFYCSDFLLFVHNPHYQSSTSFPTTTLWQGYQASYFSFKFFALYVSAFVIIWFIFYKHISLWMHSINIYTLFVPLCFGLMSMPRMLLVAFPFLFVLSSVSHKYKIQNALIIASTLLQGYMAVCWFLGFGNVV